MPWADIVATKNRLIHGRVAGRELELMGIKQLESVLTGAVYCKETGK
jgi:hypothetical protein